MKDVFLSDAPDLPQGTAKIKCKGDMYMVILKEQLITMEDGKAVCRAEIAVDTAEELVNISFTDRTLSAGSLAWDISSGDIYGLNSQGEWKIQNA